MCKFHVVILHADVCHQSSEIGLKKWNLYHCLFCFTTRQITNNTTKMYILFFSDLCQMPPLSPKSLTNSKNMPEIWTHFGVVRYLSIYEYRVCFILPVCLFYLVVQTRRQGTLRGFILVFCFFLKFFRRRIKQVTQFPRACLYLTLFRLHFKVKSLPHSANRPKTNESAEKQLICIWGILCCCDYPALVIS